MFKEGDWVKCKTVPGAVMGRKNNNIIIGNYYKILEDDRFIGTGDSFLLHIEDETGERSYWSNHFYSQEELRKDKINKILKKC